MRPQNAHDKFSRINSSLTFALCALPKSPPGGLSGGSAIVGCGKNERLIGADRRDDRRVAVASELIVELALYAPDYRPAVEDEAAVQLHDRRAGANLLVRVGAVFDAAAADDRHFAVCKSAVRLFSAASLAFFCSPVHIGYALRACGSKRRPAQAADLVFARAFQRWRPLGRRVRDDETVDAVALVCHNLQSRRA